MKELELYDIITLDDESEYTILQMMIFEGRKYYLIAPVDKEEEPNLQKIKMVEEKKINNQIVIEEETNEKTIQKLSVMFLQQIQKENED